MKTSPLFLSILFLAAPSFVVASSSNQCCGKSDKDFQTIFNLTRKPNDPNRQNFIVYPQIYNEAHHEPECHKKTNHCSIYIATQLQAGPQQGVSLYAILSVVNF